MDFSYPETHNDIIKLANDILTDYAEPGRLKKLENNGAYFDKEVWQQLQTTGLLSACLPEELGGMGMDFNASTLLAEAIGRTAIMVPFIPSIVSAAIPLSTHKHTPEVNAVLDNLVSGEGLLIAAHIEPGNEDPLQPSTSVTNTDGEWLLNGCKQCVPYAADAKTLLLSADLQGELWIGLLDLDQEGVELKQQLVTSSELQYQVNLHNAAATQVASGTEARALMQQSIAMTTMAYCSMAVGVAGKMTKIAAEYTSERKQFGVPIATFQAVAHRLANCYIDTECLKIMTVKAADDVSRGDYENETLHMAKTWCGDVMHRVSHATQHVHGGMGIDRDYHLFRFCLWAKHLELVMGNAKEHVAELADRLQDTYLQA